MFGKRFLRNEVPGLLVKDDKHSQTFVHVSSHEDLALAALNILTYRFNSGNYYGSDPGAEPARPDVGDVDALPSGVRSEAKRLLKRWQENHRDWEDARLEFEEIQTAIQTQNGEAAWDILCRRSNAEYEHISLERYTGLAALVNGS